MHDTEPPQRDGEHRRMSTRTDRLRGLEADVDSRLIEVWRAVWACAFVYSAIGDEVRAVFGSAVRAAYAQGYHDALCEDAEGRRGQLARQHGYRHH